MVSRRAKAETAADAPDDTLPHDGDRLSNQPYASETEDYQTGVASPPEENPSDPPAIEGGKGKPVPPAR